MPEPTTKIELIEAMISARSELDSLIDQIPHSAMTQPLTPGEWSVKDILAHMTSYDRWLGLTLALRGQKPPDDWVADTPLDEFNQILYAENRVLALEEVLRQSREVWAEILDAARSKTEAYLFSEQSAQGVPYKFIPCEVLKNESYGHYLEHTSELRLWLENTND